MANDYTGNIKEFQYVIQIRFFDPGVGIVSGDIPPVP